MEEDFDNADKVAQAASLVYLIALAFLGRNDLNLLDELGAGLFKLPVAADFLRLVTLILVHSHCCVVDDQHLADVTRNQNHVQVSEASQFEESLAPLVPLLQLHIVEQLIIDADESV